MALALLFIRLRLPIHKKRDLQISIPPKGLVDRFEELAAPKSRVNDAKNTGAAQGIHLLLLVQENSSICLK
jgi:hypothetical protein